MTSELPKYLGHTFKRELTKMELAKNIEKEFLSKIVFV